MTTLGEPSARSIAFRTLVAAGSLLAITASASAQGGFRVEPEQHLTVGDETSAPSGSASCSRTIRARVAAIDSVIFFNRLEAFLPGGMIYALERDLVSIRGGDLGPGNARLRSDKRPRPLVLRMNVGDCLEVTFRNLLAPDRTDEEQPATRAASMHVEGLSLVGSIASQGANVGANDSSLAEPGETKVYRWYASHEGAFVIVSAGALTSGEGDGGQVDMGLFGVVNVEPRGSTWYRSQLTAEELDVATVAVDAEGHRRIDYDAVYPPGHRFAGKPIVKVLDGTEIFHSDLNAIIANIPAGTYPQVLAAAPDNNEVDRSRDDPFREFTICYHDENALVQAFPILSTQFFAHSVRDNMAINYGTGGAGAEILSYGADQILGTSVRTPAGNAQKCGDCAYEEAFLSSWAVGDPAMVVEREDVPAGQPLATGRAIRALYEDDPSNVHHAYLNDHVKMRVVNAGVKEHHIHHLHAHQWLFQQNGDASTYLDSQAIGPGSSFTLDITYNGSGNRNKTVGDSIFHCHFYPHFAQGMWELYRVHDVFEDGTRHLPDAEIPGGSPIPALLPLPGLAMAPPPTSELPGYPFFIPGIAGHRAPHPPLDFLFDGTEIHDGGLPRHVVRGGTVLDGSRGAFDRMHVNMDAKELPEAGTAEELAAMGFHSQRRHATVTPEGNPAVFITNGLPPAAGAPFADPCVDDDGNAVGTRRVVKAAVVQADIKINKAGWHFPQSRFLSLWDDVDDYVTGRRPPEPFFVRAHSGDCIEYHHTNLVPGHYQADDFQVFSPTDIIGQHIHLVKFDVTASDGSGNGWNYEDGTFAADQVVERIEAINVMGGIEQADGSRRPLVVKSHPFFGVAGGQTTIQRWYADPLLDASGVDRTIRTVYTHDHYGPSTHQQTGLYGGLIIEPANSTWRDPETGVAFGGRFDGGPTSWRADVITANSADSYREFLLMSQDFHLAYTADGKPVNPPGRNQLPLPHLVEPPNVPSPEAISADDVGTMSVNYRNEPLALRIRDPRTNRQATGIAGDLAHAYRSLVSRLDADFNRQPNFYPPLTRDVHAGDPFTPLLRAYEGDRIQIRLMQGATEEGHNLTIKGLKWPLEPSDPRSGWRNSQMNGISEHFEFVAGPLPDLAPATSGDLLYQPGASVDDQWNGNWGMIREYRGMRNDLLPLPNNSDARIANADFSTHLNAQRICPRNAPVRSYDVTAVRAADALPGGSLVYNQGHGLQDPTALLYVLTSDLDSSGRLRSSAPREPLILRANAGDCIRVTLRNRITSAPLDRDGFNLFPMIVEQFNDNQVRPSQAVGLHPQLVYFDAREHAGINVGENPTSTVSPGGIHTYVWYAGSIDVENDGTIVATPVEFGSVNLMPADPLQHSSKGLVGALVIEPRGSTWTLPAASSRATADIVHPGGRFREFVMVFQDDLILQNPDGTPVPVVDGGTLSAPNVEDAEDTGNKAMNYRTEPLWTRLGYPPGADLGATRDLDFSRAFSNATGAIETPLFVAEAGTPVRFRVLQPGGHGRNHALAIAGHQWRRDPRNPVSDVSATRAGIGPSDHFDVVPFHGAGGAMGIPGDYLWRDRATVALDAGTWGVFRVTPRAGIPVDNPPVAAAGPDRTGFVGESITFDASASRDPEGATLAYSWRFASSLVPVTGRTVVHTFTSAGVFEVVLEVSDGMQTDTDVVRVTISTRPNRAPVANAGPDLIGVAGDALRFDGRGSFDPDGDALTFTWTFDDGLAPAMGAVVDRIFDEPGTYMATLVVSDGALSASDTARVIVRTADGLAPGIYLAFSTSTILPGLGRVENEDIVRYDPATAMFAIVFDGSDVGLAAATLDGFCLLPTGDILLGFAAPVDVPGLMGGPAGTLVDDSDIVRFTPTSLGDLTVGTFSFHFDGSDIGLTTDGEDVDAIGLDASGNLVLSTVGAAAVPGLTGITHADLLTFSATSLGAATAGSFSMFFDGSDVGLSASGEGIDAVFIAADGRLYLSAPANFGVTGLSGPDEDVFRFTPATLGATTAGTFDLYLDASTIGVPTTADVVGIAVVDVGEVEPPEEN